MMCLSSAIKASDRMRLPLMMGALFSPVAGLLISLSIRAGRMPYELEQLLLFQSPLELTYRALLKLLQFGERSHQLVADSSRTLYQAENPQDTLIFPVLSGVRGR